ncbi:MAG: hypothetical protein IJK53_09540 [Erysipelotrichaceae bacterium]|nr:hypothetical protein [Erysipelotrichaceae bacterium]
MNRNYAEMPNGYLETIQRGISGVRRFENGISRGTGTREKRSKGSGTRSRQQMPS